MTYFLFQFHKGTIRTFIGCFILQNLAHFNSIKVRLEHNYDDINEMVVKFQFHKGTIRTILTEMAIISVLMHFNSIKVRLELEWTNKDVKDFIHFNSIKVRLELHKLARLQCYKSFQFHKGTIRTLNPTRFSELETISIP